MVGAAYLERASESGRSERIPLNKVQVVIGRAKPADILIRKPEVSRKHAEIIRVEGGYYLRDKGSKHGTHHNGVRIRHVHLRNGDRIRIGPVELIFREPPQTPLDPRSAFEVVD